MKMSQGIPKNKSTPVVKEPRNIKLRRVIEWMGGVTITDVHDVYLSKSALFTLDREIKGLKELTMTSNWWLYDDETNELLASKHPETTEEKAIRLYKEIGNYAEVARQLRVHPTTIRTWCKTKGNE